MSGEEPEWMSWTLEDLNLHQSQRQVEKPIATPVVIIDDDSDTGSTDSFKSTEENDPTANARLDVIECLTWAMNLEFREDVDPKMIEGMKRNAKNLKEDDRRTFNDCLCNYMTQHAIWKDMGRFTPLLSEATHETLALVTEEIHLLYGRIKNENDPKSLFFGMEREKNDFLCACNAWEQRRSDKERYVPKTKKLKFGHSFTSDVVSSDAQMAQVFAMSAEHARQNNEQVGDEVETLRKKLDQEGLVEEVVPPVGNCVFEAMTRLADALLGIHIGPQEMREKVVEYIGTYPREFSGLLMAEMVEDSGLCELIGVQSHTTPKEKWKAYLAYMKRPGRYGGSLEILAFVRMYGCTATVVKADADNLVFEATSGLQTPHVAYFVFYKNGRHYNPAYLFH